MPCERMPNHNYERTILPEKVLNDENILEAVLEVSGSNKTDFFEKFDILATDTVEICQSLSDTNYGGTVYKVYRVRSEGNKIRRDLLRSYEGEDVIKIIDYLVMAKKQGGENKGE